jgi:hypothetical protein
VVGQRKHADEEVYQLLVAKLCKLGRRLQITFRN